MASPLETNDNIIFTMLKNYFKLAWRNLIKDRRFAFLNLIGLSTGLACALMIYIWVQDELHIDKFHKNDATLFQVLENRVQASGIWTAKSSPVPMAGALVKDMPEVEYAAYVSPVLEGIISVKNEKNIRTNGKYADKDFFKMFSYELITGNADQVLKDPASVVLSDVLAKNLFGSSENVIGKIVDFQHEEQFVVSGVFKSPGPQSSEQFDFMLPVRSLEMVKRNADEWGNTAFNTFLILKPGTNIEKFNAKIAGYIKLKTNNEITYRTPFIQRYSENYLYGRYENGIQVGGRIDYVRLFSLVAIFILVIACINFMNLSTAKASGRAKEVGIKKAMGAGRGALILQYLGESMVMAFTSLLLAVLMAILFLPVFNSITGKQLTLFHPDVSMIMTTLGITLFTGLIAGSYPAFHLSGFKPVTVLKGKIRGSAGELFVRKGLVVFQFSLSIILIVAVLVSFDYQFLDERYQTLYKAESQISQLSRYFAGLAVLISCLGLFGLAAFTAQRRNKEIGIRKVLGATVSTIVMMLSKDFLRLVLIAMLIAFPVAWWATAQWLKGFAYSIHFDAGIFLIAGVVVILLTFFTISFQSVKAALANPVKSLKSE